ncbi:N-acetylmuramoyl-L-alanine amidase [Amycolatopsis tucumanensis]|uniref:N-acetylmuramoyl-L-alanine amidase n=1 Tax=Amycolatopsis tucumanensis TaxID=401106 RepID=UPI001F293409|nr:N-acetylmuramoyl-L-alanine amidase [Amycolatopsis tucumanensis]MCF6422060.1 N-acetylmuramoyl-L-alanine amidase [Amycolatopsis tucumanensis]
MFAVRSLVGLVLSGVLLVAGCSSPAPPPPVPSAAARVSSVPAPVSSSVASSVAREPVTVVLDPGHNGGNARRPDVINAPVPAGRGETKPCNTTGTATDRGYAEHAFNWDVAQRVGSLLEAQGVRVVYTRADDTGVGPCVNERAAIGNRAGAAAVVSIHADGATSAGARGFHVAYSAPPLNAAQGAPSVELAEAVRSGLLAGDFPLSNYLGSDGLAPRDDLAGLNLSERPAVLVECGNMRNAAEAATMSSVDGRARYATAIASGVVAFLREHAGF